MPFPPLWVGMIFLWGKREEAPSCLAEATASHKKGKKMVVLVQKEKKNTSWCQFHRRKFWYAYSRRKDFSSGMFTPLCGHLYSNLRTLNPGGKNLFSPFREECLWFMWHIKAYYVRSKLAVLDREKYVQEIAGGMAMRKQRKGRRRRRCQQP